MILLLSRTLPYWLLFLSLTSSYSAPITFTPLARFDATAKTAAQTRQTQPINADMAARLALLQHPKAKEILLEIGTTPNALLAAGWLHEGKLDIWKERKRPTVPPCLISR